MYYAATSHSTLITFPMKIMLQSEFDQGTFTSQCPSSGYVVKSVGLTVCILLPQYSTCVFHENHVLVKIFSRDISMFISMPNMELYSGFPYLSMGLEWDEVHY